MIAVLKKWFRRSVKVPIHNTLNPVVLVNDPVVKALQELGQNFGTSIKDATEAMQRLNAKKPKIRYKDPEFIEELKLRFREAKAWHLREGRRIFDAHVRADVFDLLDVNGNSTLHGVRLTRIDTMRSCFQMLTKGMEPVEGTRCATKGCCAPVHRGLNHCLFHATTPYSRYKLFGKE